MVKQKTINSNQKMTNMIKKNYVDTDPLAELVYIKSIKEQIEERLTSKYLKRIDYLVGANNELMKELEQWERVGKRLEKKTITKDHLKEGVDYLDDIQRNKKKKKKKDD